MPPYQLSKLQAFIMVSANINQGSLLKILMQLVELGKDNMKNHQVPKNHLISCQEQEDAHLCTGL